MIWYQKIIEMVESADSIELKIYRNKVRDDLLKELGKQREKKLNQGKYPYQGRWLTHDEIVLAREQERSENISKFALILLIYLALLAGSILMSYFVWRSAV
jgi:hypothetical protein